MSKYSAVLVREVATEIKLGALALEANGQVIEAGSALEALHVALRASPNYDGLRGWWEGQWYTLTIPPMPKKSEKGEGAVLAFCGVFAAILIVLVLSAWAMKLSPGFRQDCQDLINTIEYTYHYMLGDNIVFYDSSAAAAGIAASEAITMFSDLPKSRHCGDGKHTPWDCAAVAAAFDLAAQGKPGGCIPQHKECAALDKDVYYCTLSTGEVIGMVVGRTVQIIVTAFREDVPGYWANQSCGQQ